MSGKSRTDPPIQELLTHPEEQLVAGIHLPDLGALTEDQRREVRENVQQYVRDNAITVEAMARSIGQGGASTWCQILSGKYESGRLDHYLRLVNRWVDDDARRRHYRAQPDFVATKVAETIHTAVELAKQNRAIYLVVGPSGVGKSLCAKVACEQFPGTLLVTLHGDLRTRYQIRDALVARLRLHRVRGRRRSMLAREYTGAVFDRLRGSGRLLIVDEGHQIAKGGLDFLRDLYDQTACPILILATMDLWQEILKQADEDHGQFYSRVRRCIDLTDEVKSDSGKRLFTAEHVRKIFNTRRFKVQLDRGAIDYLVQVANAFGKGSLRTCRALVEDAATLIRNRTGASTTDWVKLDLAILAECHKASRRERVSATWVQECFENATVAAAG